MAATLATFASILKEFYLGPIQDQLNNETLVSDMFEKASVDWNGRQVIIPVHVTRNANVGFVAETNPLPGPNIGALAPNGSQQGYVNLTCTSQFLYGRFQITGPAMASAGKGGANSFVGWVDGEMNRLVQDIKNQSDRAATSGGTCVGFVTHGTQITPAMGALQLPFDGDAVKLAALVAVGGAGVVDIVRLDTYATVRAAGAQITIIAGVAPGQVGVATAVGNLNFALDPAGNFVPCALIATAVATAGGADFTNEPVGIYGNIGLPGTGVAGQELDWFAVDRTTATGTANALQCGDGAAVPTSNTLSACTVINTRVNINMQIMQTVMDRITLASDEVPDVILCNPLQRTRLAATLQGNFNFNTDKSGGGNNVADGGYSGFAFAGIPVKASRHVDNGLMLALSTKAWKMLELESGKFADEDGDVLSRVGILDAYEGFYKWYYQTVCLRPNSNGLITGLTL